MTQLLAHPYADLFPMASPEDFERLVADIGANGLVEPITLYQGKILDGRNRCRALVERGWAIESHAVEFDGDDAAALAFVVSKNLARRHLNESQRAMVAARLETLKHGRPRKDANLHVSRNEAAKKLSVSARSIATAKRVQEKGSSSVCKAVEDGKLSLNAAAKIAELSTHEQERIMEHSRPDTAVKKVARQNKERDLAAKQCALPERKFGVIYADPAWSFATYSENGMDRAADNHYPTMTTADICALDVPGIAADDCVLFL